MPIGNGFWASGSANELGQQSPFPSTYYIPFLALLDDVPPREEITCFSLTSETLCNLSGFFRTITISQPSLHGYSRNFHRYNEAAARLNRFSYWISMCYKKNFNRSFVEVLDHYLAKVIYIQGNVERDFLAPLAEFRHPAVVVCETPSCVRVARSLGIRPIQFNHRLPAAVNRQIGKSFCVDPERLLSKGFTKEECVPASIIHKFPGKFVFRESSLPTPSFCDLTLLRPNQSLSCVLRRKYVPAGLSAVPPKPDRIKTLLESTRTVFAEKIVDHLVSEPSDVPPQGISMEFRAALSAYDQGKTADAYANCVHEAEKCVDQFPGACDFILCSPAINRRVAMRFFRTNAPTRILKLVFRQRSDDYQLWFSPKQEFKSSEEFSVFTALEMMQARETDYLSNVLTLHSITSRRPALRTPQLPSSIFGELKNLRLAYESSRTATFLKTLNKVSGLLESAIPSEIKEFVSHTSFQSIKLVSDLPLEWLRIRGAPLMFQATVSRIPLTPGNSLLVHYQNSRGTIRLGKDEISRTLILNCFEREDPLYCFARGLSETLTEMGINAGYAEPATTKEYTEFLETKKPCILIQFGHGSYDRSVDRGYLHIRSERTEVWSFQNVFVPPIIVLGACESAALAETHNTPSNGWLAIGARCVLGTLYPVQAALTTTLFARLMANLHEAVFGTQQMPTWEIVVSKTLMLNRYLDFLYGYELWRLRRQLAGIPGEFIFEFTYRWNHAGLDLADGYNQCTDLMVDAFRRFGEEFAESFSTYLQTEPPLPHTMFFTHLGSPETIHIVKEELASPDNGNPALMYWNSRVGEEQSGR